MTAKVAVIDYGAGNLRSVCQALRHVAPAETEIALASDAKAIAEATHLVLPGVGAFADCMHGLQALPDVIAVLERRVLQEGVPFLGICVGMQMLLETGHEHGRHAGLGWIAGEVVPLAPQDKALKIPHMGWNELTLAEAAQEVARQEENFLSGVLNGDHAYFVHSYHCRPTDASLVTGWTEYGGPVAAILQRNNIMAVQFHPEKSQQTGLLLLKNFLKLPARW